MFRFHRTLKPGLRNAGLVIVVASVSILLINLRDGNRLAAANVHAAGMRELPIVQVSTLTARNSRVWESYSGRLKAVDRVEIRPLVSGTITEVLFQEGAIVKKGDPLFVIDPRPYRAALADATAALRASRSQARLAQTELVRAESLVKRRLIAQSLYDSARNTYKVALASIDAAEAKLTQAELSVEYAHIRAPIAGRVSRAEITAGNVIEAGPDAPVLTTVVSIERLYAEFDIDEQTYIKTIRGAKTGDLRVRLSLSGDEHTEYPGDFHSLDNHLDTTSGTIRARAIFDSRDGMLIPGMYAKIKVASTHAKPYLLINPKWVGTDQNRKYVYVIAGDDRVAYREVELGPSVGESRIVVAGLESGDRVVVNGMQRLQPGMMVRPVDASAEFRQGSSAG